MIENRYSKGEESNSVIQRSEATWNLSPLAFK